MENDVIMQQEKDLYAIIGETKKVKVKGKVWEISACSISELPKLQRLLDEFEKIQIGSENDQFNIEIDLFNIMAKIIKMGLIEKHPGINIEKIKQEFSLSALPVIINIMMDLNDFLSGMKGIRQKL